MFVNVIDVGDDTTLAHVSYYDDGTVVFRDPPPPAVGMGARRLTTAGAEALERAIEATGLLQASWDEALPDGAAWDHTYSIVTRAVVLNATDRGADPKADAIVALARKLAGPASWLPPSSWVGTVTDMSPYRPASIRLWIHRQEEPLDPSRPSTEAIAWPLPGTFETFGKFDESLPGTGPRSGDLSVDDALALFRALDATGADSWGGPVRAEYHFTDVDPDTVVVFELRIEAGEFGP